jgi:hypothetical protein
MSLEEQFAKIHAEQEDKEMRLVAAQLRKFLAGALCAVCGDPLGTEDEIIQDDDDRTMHARCESSDPEQNAEGS